MKVLYKKSFWAQVQKEINQWKYEDHQYGLCGPSVTFWAEWNKPRRMEVIRDLAADFIRSDDKYSKDITVPSWGQFLFEFKPLPTPYRLKRNSKRRVTRMRQIRRDFLAWCIQNVESIHQKNTVPS